jgi:hypothetical protein
MPENENEDVAPATKAQQDVAKRPGFWEGRTAEEIEELEAELYLMSPPEVRRQEMREGLVQLGFRDPPSTSGSGSASSRKATSRKGAS